MGRVVPLARVGDGLGLEVAGGVAVHGGPVDPIVHFLVPDDLGDLSDVFGVLIGHGVDVEVAGTHEDDARKNENEEH